MSWNRTVRCSNCWKTGHNKSGCPDRKAQYEREKKENPESWWVKQYEADEARRKTRACGYCKEEGHTKRTCKWIATDKARTVLMNKEWRENVLAYFKKQGLGIGALVQIEDRSWGREGVENVMISDIFWKNLTFMIKQGRNPWSFQVRPVADFSRTKNMDFPVDSDGQVSHVTNNGIRLEVLSPVTSASIEGSVPEGWLTGSGPIIDNMFLDSKGKTKERYYIDWIEK